MNRCCKNTWDLTRTSDSGFALALSTRRVVQRNTVNWTRCFLNLKKKCRYIVLFSARRQRDNVQNARGIIIIALTERFNFRRVGLRNDGVHPSQRLVSKIVAVVYGRFCSSGMSTGSRVLPREQLPVSHWRRDLRFCFDRLQPRIHKTRAHYWRHIRNPSYTHVSFGIEIIGRYVVDHHVKQRRIEQNRFGFYHARRRLIGTERERLQIVIRAIGVAATIDVTATALYYNDRIHCCYYLH